MQMMYDTVYKALEEANLEKTYHPRDYLTFFCLGNREVDDGYWILPPAAPPANTPQVTFYLPPYVTTFFILLLRSKVVFLLSFELQTLYQLT